MSTVGYARVSTREQDPAAQRAELEAAGAERVFVDRGESSTTTARPEWVACLDYLRAGDTLVIRALDRVAGTEVMAIEIIRELGRRGVRLRSLTEPFLDVDTSTPMGEAIVGIMAVLAQLRVATIRENTRRGLAHARSQGRVGGRPTVMTPERLTAAVRLRGAGTSYGEIASVLGGGSRSHRSLEHVALFAGSWMGVDSDSRRCCGSGRAVQGRPPADRTSDAARRP